MESYLYKSFWLKFELDFLKFSIYNHSLEMYYIGWYCTRNIRYIFVKWISIQTIIIEFGKMNRYWD